jgi:hypothetical protein
MVLNDFGGVLVKSGREKVGFARFSMLRFAGLRYGIFATN